MPPPGSERVSADQTCSMKFCSAIDRPNVAIRDGSGSSPITRLRMVYCRSQPIAAARGTSISISVKGPSPKIVAREMPISANKMMRSPWAMLTIRMTPNINAMPRAYCAYIPPSSAPWITASSHGMAESEIGFSHLGVADCIRPTRQSYASLQHAIEPIRRLLSQRDILLDQDQRCAGCRDRGHNVIDLPDHARSKTKRDLVAKKQARLA